MDMKSFVDTLNRRKTRKRKEIFLFFFGNLFIFSEDLPDRSYSDTNTKLNLEGMIVRGGRGGCGHF